MNKKTDNIFLINDSGELEKVPLVHYESENLLQTLIEKYPEILAGDQIGGDESIRWFLVKREAGIPDADEIADRWSVDHLLLDQNAIPTLVEVKRSTDTRIRREVVGQMLEYAANVDQYWPADRIRALAVGQHGGTEKVDAMISSFLDLEPEEDNTEAIEKFWSQVESNLHSGQLRLLFVADELPREVRRIIEFLNEKMRDVEVLGVELRQYVGGKLRAMVPRVIGQTEAIRQAKARKATPTRHTNRQEFLSVCQEDVRQFFETTLDEARQRGLTVYWGTKGFSLRSPDINSELHSIFYGYPPGALGCDTASIQGYLSPPLRETPFGEYVRKRFLSIDGFTQQGAYTLKLLLTKETIESAQESLKIVWGIADHLSGNIKDPSP